MSVLHFDPLETDGAGHGSVQRVVLVEVWPYSEDTAPGVCDGVQPHHLAEAHVLVLVERPGVGALEGVIDGNGGPATVVNVAGVTGGRALTLENHLTVLYIDVYSYKLFLSRQTAILSFYLNSKIFLLTLLNNVLSNELGS